MRIEYPDLPVSARRDDIMAAIAAHQVVIVAGATGSGKTTQLPKMCLELGRTSIGHTQPRRIAARTIAERIAEELGETLGETVGYKVRFTDVVSETTKIKVMTDGILLAEMHRDPLLAAYDTIIIDEAHERSLTIDFLIGYLKRLTVKRPVLKIIITSATIDPESFSRHFGGAPIIEVSGRTFPVDVRYRPLAKEAMDDDEGEDLDPIDGIAGALAEIEREDDGDVLVFLPSEAEIREAQRALTGRLGDRTEILPLYGRLSAAEQHRVFERSARAGIRRCVVLATNVAETSLTVPGIRHVIDTGTARISRYSVRAKVQRLPIEAISQASANQRSGRAGRVAPGIAIRLYAEDDFEKRPAFTDPEILRTNLAAVILQAATLELGPLEEFPFLQPPDARGLRDGRELLVELGALSPSGKVTKVGRELARLPVDPRFGRMAIAGRDAGVGREVVAIVAGLTIQDPRERPLEKREQAAVSHSRFLDPSSDFITLLALWNHVQELQSTLSGNQFRRTLKSEYLSFLRIREWQDVVRQLSRSLRLPRDKEAASEAPDADAIHRAMLTGLLSRIGVRDDSASNRPRPGESKRRARMRAEYLGSRGTRFQLFPGSGLAANPPRGVMSAELVETSRLFARTNASVDLAWAEPIAGDLAKRQISEPHWERKQGAVVAFEKVTLFGVPIIERRKIQFQRIDPEYARELFIRHALVDGEWDSPQDFDRKNRALIRELERLEERQRRRDLLAGDEAVFDFFDARIPADVASTRSFEGWWRKERVSQPDLLTMTRADLVGEDASIDARAFPTRWKHGDQELRLTYRFEPGAADDGVTVHVPVAVLPRITEAGFDWLVPGMREELLTAMIKALPKHVRKHVVPAADWARSMLAELPESPTERSLAETLAARIARTAHVQTTAADVDLHRVPDHLKPTFAIEDGRGRTLGKGKDLGALQRRFQERSRQHVAKAAERVTSDLERDSVTGFDTELPDHIDVQQGRSRVRAYPGYALTDGGEVGIRLATTAETRDAAQRQAVRGLLVKQVPSPAPYVQANLTAEERLALGASPYRSTNALFDDMLLAIIDSEMTPVTSVAEFEALRARVSDRLVERMFALAAEVAAILSAHRAADRAIREGAALQHMTALADARAQLDAIVFDGFIARTGVQQLPRLKVYLKAIEHRVRRLSETAHRDQVWMREIGEARALYDAAGGSVPLAADAPEHIRAARWMLEELRVSLFAQHLGAAGPVSLQRIRKSLAH